MRARQSRRLFKRAASTAGVIVCRQNEMEKWLSGSRHGLGRRRSVFFLFISFISYPSSIQLIFRFFISPLKYILFLFSLPTPSFATLILRYFPLFHFFLFPFFHFVIPFPSSLHLIFFLSSSYFLFPFPFSVSLLSSPVESFLPLQLWGRLYVRLYHRGSSQRRQHGLHIRFTRDSNKRL